MAATDWKAVGARIRARRDVLGLTQEQLGKAVGSSANYVAQVEKGLAISEGKLVGYSAVLGMSLPLLRYGVAMAEDAERITAIAKQEGRAEVLAEIRAWLDSVSVPRRTAKDVLGAGPLAGARKLTEEELDRADAITERAARSKEKPATKAAKKRRKG